MARSTTTALVLASAAAVAARRRTRRHDAPSSRRRSIFDLRLLAIPSRLATKDPHHQCPWC